MWILIPLLLCAPAQVGTRLTVLEAPPAVGAGLQASCRVSVENTGSCALPLGEPVNLSYHWVREGRGMAVFDGLRTPLPLPLGPGESAEVELRLLAPSEPGRYLLKPDAVWEHRFWFSELGGGSGPEVAVRVEPIRLTLRGRTPGWSAAGVASRVEVVVSNDGPLPLRKGDRIRLGYRYQPIWPGGPSLEEWPAPLPADLAPGESQVVPVSVQPPLRQGVFRFAWEAVGPEGTILARAPAARPAVNIRLSSLYLPLLGAIVLILSVPSWRRRASPLLPLLPWLWFVLAMSWKAIGVSEAAGQWPAPRLALFTPLSFALLGVPFLLTGWRARSWGLGALHVLLSIVLFGDLVYFRFFGDLPSAGTLAHWGQLGAVKGSVPSLLASGTLFVLADLPFILLALFWGLKRVPPPPRAPLLRGMAAGVVLLAFLPLAAAQAARARGEAASLFRQRFENAFLAGELGVVNYHLYDAWTWAVDRFRGHTLPAEERERVRRWFAAPRAAPASPFTGKARGLNFLLIQEESLEAGALDLEVDGVPVMPFLQAVRSDCLEFPAYFDETAHGRTSDAEFMLLTSLHPAAGGSAFFLHAGDRFRTLAHRFRENGYTTLFAHPHERGFWNRYAVYPGFGFDRLMFKKDFRPGRTIGWGLADRDFFEQTVRTLEALPRPFFALLVTLTDHHPYQDLPVPVSELPLGPHKGTLLGRYLKVCRTKDRALEALARNLRRTGLLDETVVVVYGDHDAGLGWDLDLMRSAGLPARGPLDRYEADRLPLLIRGPGWGGGIVPRAGGHADLGPTLLDLAGLDPGPAPYLGQSLLGPGEGWAVFPDASFRTDRLRLVRRGFSGRPECWDLEARREVEIDRCRPDYDRTVERLAVSRAILDGGLVPELLEAAGQAP